MSMNDGGKSDDGDGGCLVGSDPYSSRGVPDSSRPMAPSFTHSSAQPPINPPKSRPSAGLPTITR